MARVFSADSSARSAASSPRACWVAETFSSEGLVMIPSMDRVLGLHGFLGPRATGFNSRGWLEYPASWNSHVPLALDSSPGARRGPARPAREGPPGYVLAQPSDRSTARCQFSYSASRRAVSIVGIHWAARCQLRRSPSRSGQ
ncbi:hypothetical protein SANTM175S_02143 [Streptomyces antimycoticus]